MEFVMSQHQKVLAFYLLFFHDINADVCGVALQLAKETWSL